MNVDSIFTIGKTHKVCQDYTSTGFANGNPFIVVSDGCSSSPDTDFGARLLTRVCSSFYTDYREIDPEEIMLEAEDMSRLLGLNPLSLDATLLCASVKEGSYDLRVFGDGVVVKTRREDGAHEIVVVEYVSGAPYYLNYSLDPKRKLGYAEKFGFKRKMSFFTLDSAGTMTDCRVEEDSEGLHYQERDLAAPYSSISLMSDGALSFYGLVNTGTSKLQMPVALTSVLQRLLAFKGYQGDFVQRRVQKFKKDIEKENWHHADDLSLATMYFGE